MFTRSSSPTLHETIAKEARPPVFSNHNTKSQLVAFQKAEEQLRKKEADLNGVLQAIGHTPRRRLRPNIITAEIGTLDREIARSRLQAQHDENVRLVAENFHLELQDAAESNLVGEIEWLNDRSCRLSYFDTKRERTLLAIIDKRLKHTHDLVDAKRLPVWSNQVNKPRKCQELIQALPRWLAKQSYLVTGTLILANTEQFEASVKPSELVVAARWVGSQLKKGAKAIRDSTTAAMAIPREMSTAILRDPAVCFGNTVFFGWKE